MTSPVEFILVVPTEIATYGAAAAIVLAHLRYRCNVSEWCRVTQADLAESVGLSRDQVARALEKLPVTVLERQQTADRDRTVLYRAVPAIVRIRTGSDLSLCENAQCIVRNCTGHCAESHNVLISKKVEEENLLSDTSDIAAKQVTAKATKAADKAALEAEFEDWWKLYPRKEAKIVAKAAYVKARAKTDVDTLTAGVKAYAALMASKPTSADGRSCIAHGATWLNQERWTDENIAHAVPQSLEDLTAWLRDCWTNFTILPIKERTGMTYPNPMPPTDCEDREAWRNQAKRIWIEENRAEILRRAGMKAVS